MHFDIILFALIAFFLSRYLYHIKQTTLLFSLLAAIGLSFISNERIAYGLLIGIMIVLVGWKRTFESILVLLGLIVMKVLIVLLCFYGADFLGYHLDFNAAMLYGNITLAIVVYLLRMKLRKALFQLRSYHAIGYLALSGLLSLYMLILFFSYNQRTPSLLVILVMVSMLVYMTILLLRKVQQVQIENDDLTFHEKNYQILEDNLNNLQAQRHHQRKYILNLLKNLNDQDYTSLRDSLEDALIALNKAYTIHTGQETMNRIISSVLPLITEKHIQLYTSYYDGPVPLSKQDYSLLISTLIMHAMRQCQEPYKIMINQYQEDHHYILEIRYTSKEIEPVDVYFHSNMTYTLNENYVIMQYQKICG